MMVLAVCIYMVVMRTDMEFEERRVGKGSGSERS